MSGSGYGYYYPTNTQNFPVARPQNTDSTQSWSSWTLEQQQYNESYNRANIPYQSNPLNHVANHTNTHLAARPQNFYPTNNRHYQHQPRRYNSNTNAQFSPNGNAPQPWQRPGYKRPRPQDPSGDHGEPKSKNTKKKKKPLSQNVPSKKDWTVEEAEQALAVEKEYNKRFKNHSLIIKFPDLELNREIVTKYHPAIENVHFQQPSTPRFCFVTLEENANPDTVITALNKIKFGDGHLTAEYKKDREEDQNIGPEDIDPCTLYVGNLAQEITKEDMVKAYPKGRRIDIGYAKKMKYTRYAFVSFKNVTDSIEAFRKTHSTQMYSKSLIVRFRRLHGTVGMPGEAKPQSPAKSRDVVSEASTSERATPEAAANANEMSDRVSNHVADHVPDHVPDHVSNDESVHLGLHSDLDLSVVKRELESSDGEYGELFETPFTENSTDESMAQHRLLVKQEIKEEKGDDVTQRLWPAQEEETLVANGSRVEVGQDKDKAEVAAVVKKESEETDDLSDDDLDENLGDVNFGSLLNQLEHHSSRLESLRKSVP